MEYYYGENIVWFVYDPETGLKSKDLNIKLVRRGDANGDGKFNIDDAIAIMRHLAWLPVYVNGVEVSIDKVAGDADLDGKLTVDDARSIARYFASLGW